MGAEISVEEMCMVELVLAKERDEARQRLMCEVFEGEPGIELSQEDDALAFYSREDLDAFLLHPRFAYEGFGGSPRPSDDPNRFSNPAQILSADVERGPWIPGVLYAIQAPWVIAQPSFRLGTPKSYWSAPQCQATYEMWARIFEAIEEHAATGAQPNIKRLGCGLGENMMFYEETESENRAELEAMLRAFRAFGRVELAPLPPLTRFDIEATVTMPPSLTPIPSTPRIVSGTRSFLLRTDFTDGAWATTIHLPDQPLLLHGHTAQALMTCVLPSEAMSHVGSGTRFTLWWSGIHVADGAVVAVLP